MAKKGWRDYSSDNSTSGNKAGSWRSYSKYDTATIVGEDVTNRVNNWLNSHNAYISDYQKRFANRKGTYEDAFVGDSADWLNTLTQQRKELATGVSDILSYLDQYQDYLDADWMKQVRTALSSASGTQDQIIESSRKDNEYWSNFGTEEMVNQYGSAEDAYKTYQRYDGYSKKYAGKTYDELEKLLNGLDDGEEKDWLTSHANSAKIEEQNTFDTAAGAKEIEELENFYDQAFMVETWYNAYQMNPYAWTDEEVNRNMALYNTLKQNYGSITDLEKLISKKKGFLNEAKDVQELVEWSSVSGNEDFKNNSQYVDNVSYNIFGNPRIDDKTYAYVNNPTIEGESARAIIEGEHSSYSWDTPNRNRESSYKRDALDYIRSDEVAIYNYYYATEGAEKARAYLDLLVPTLKARRDAETVEKVSAFADKHPVLSSILSVGTSLGSGFEYLEDVIEYGGDKIFGKDTSLDTNESALATNAVRGTVAENVDWEIGNWDAFDFVYNTTMSGIDSLASTAFGGGGGVVLGLSAAAQGTNDALARGMSDGQAFWNGLFSGVFEGLFESISIGNFNALKETAVNVGLKNIDKRVIKTIAKNIGKSMLVNASEEALTEIANIAYDTLVNGEFANYTLEELQNGAWKQALNQVIESGLSGAFMGMGMSALGSSIGHAKGVKEANSYALKHYGGNTDAIIQEGLESAKKSSSYKLAQKYQKQTQGKDGKSGKALTGAQIRNLLAANQEQITAKDIERIEEAAAQRLVTIGMREDVLKTAKLATKYATGGELTRAERSFLANNKYGAQVTSELLEDGIAPDNLLSKWENDMTDGMADTYSTEWRENIGTKSVNRAAYDKNNFEAEVKAKVRSIVERIGNNTYKSLEDRVGNDEKLSVSDTGKATIRESNAEIDLSKPEIVDFVRDKETGKVTDMVLKVDGKEVKASEIDFADDNQSYLFSAVSQIEHMTPGDAQVIVRGYDSSSGLSVGEYLNGIDEAYTYGYYNYSEADLNAGKFVSSLTSDQMKGAYLLGKTTRANDINAKETSKKRMRTADDAEAEKSQKKLTKKQKTAEQKARFESDAEVYFMDGKSVVKFDEAVEDGKYEEHQMAAVNYAKFLSKMGIGGKYYFFESYKKGNTRYYKDIDGVEKPAPNGKFDIVDGIIYIDMYAGNAGQGVTLFTLSHELTHFIREWSESKFKVLSDFLIEEYGKTNMSMHERVLAKQSELSQIRKKKVSYDEAFEEVVADAMSTMLADGNLHEKLAKLKTKDKNLFDKIKEFFENMIAKFQALYKDLPPEQQDAIDVREMKNSFDRIQQAFAEALVEASENFQAAMESVVEANAKPMSADEIVMEGAVVTDGNGERHSIRSMKHDIAEGKMFEDLKNVCGWTQAQVNTLKTQLKDLVEYMIPYRNILDMNETYGMEGRRFSPYKPNSDPLYKISMDFSTLCSKRLLTQYVIEQLQLRENRPMSAEEQMAIRDMLNEYRKVEKGLQVACAMCYVEAARLKSPKQIQRWLDDPTPHLINYFALKNSEFNASVKKAQADFKESKGYGRDTPKKDMKQADVTALNKIGPKMRSQYQPSAEEQVIIDKAKTLPNETYLTAGNLADLSENEPVIYNAYTSFVRTATRSKSLEKDEPYYYGDSTRDNGNGIIVTDSFIEAVNRENGMRFSSWSDWRIQHLLDYIIAVIDNSVRGAAMHGYTKFGDEVRVLGKTGMMFNMSGVAGTQTGLNEDGSLSFSETESIDVNEAIQLREEFPEHAGLQCIGVSDEHIIALLRSDIIDYVIPYHVSGLNAVLRRMVNIYGWADYTGTQHASIDKSIKFENAVDKEHWHEEPVFSEFFVGYDTGMTGIEAMRASAEKYKQMCKDRGLTPKFNQFASEDNYWKLLIDRKMINQQTGNLIRQKAVTPTFDFGVIRGVVDKFVENYDAGLEARALNHVVENWDSIPQRIKDLKKQGGTKSKKTTRAVNTLANQTVAAQPKDGVKNSDRKWNPNLDSIEWGLVKYAVEHYQGTAITSTCNMFFKKSKGRAVFGIYSTEDSTLLYASTETKAAKEFAFVDLLAKEYENGYAADRRAEDVRTLIERLRVQQTSNNGHVSGSGTSGRYAGNGRVHGAKYGRNTDPALRNVLENIFEKENERRTGDRRVKKSERDSTGKQLSNEQQEFFKNSMVRDADGNLLPVYHSTSEDFNTFEVSNASITGEFYYFAVSKTWSKKFHQEERYSDPKHIKKCYLNLTNVFDMRVIPNYTVYGGGGWYGNEWIKYIQDKGINLDSRFIEMWSTPQKNKFRAWGGVPAWALIRYDGFTGLRESLIAAGYDGIVYYDKGRGKVDNTVYVAFHQNQIKLASNKHPTTDSDTRYSERSNAPVFYSQMGKVVDGMKQEKFGASSVISMLRGRGVKAEEIRWSGIQAFLDGKKSVTKAELLEFIKGSMLQIEEQELGETLTYTDEERAELDALEVESEKLWDEIAELWKKLFNEDVPIQLLTTDFPSGRALRKLKQAGLTETEDGIRLDKLTQEVEFNGSKVAAVADRARKRHPKAKWNEYKLGGGDNYRELLFKMPGSTYSNDAMQAHWGRKTPGVLAHARMQDFEVDGKKMLFIEEIQSDWHNVGARQGYGDLDAEKARINAEYDERLTALTKLQDKLDEYNERSQAGEYIEDYYDVYDEYITAGHRVEASERLLRHMERGIYKIAPDAPFKGNYHEYVLKRLIRMAAEEGYDSIGWTTADIQSDRWSDEFSEGYRIEYDQDIPKFLKKYGKQWGAEVGKTEITTGELTDWEADMIDKGIIEVELPTSTVWSMDITPAMKKSVMEEGQVMYSERGDGLSNRHLLANAFEGITKSSIEYSMIQDYKGYVNVLNMLDKRLSVLNDEIHNVRFTKGKYDAEKLQKLESERNDLAKEINRYDKMLLNLEASEPLRKVIAQERKKEAQKTKEHIVEIQQNKKVRAEQTELRHKIRKVIRDLDKILKHGNKQKNVKEDLQPVVTKALQAAEILFTDNYGNYDMLRNGIGADLSDAEEALVKSCAKMLKDLDKMPTDGYENWQARQEAENKLKTKMSNLKDVFARERKRLNNTTVSSILGELADAYASLEKSEQSYVQGAYSEAVHNFLKSLQSEVGGTIVKDMTKDQLESVYAAYKMVLNTVRNANKMFNEELKQSREQLGNAVIEEVIKAGGVHLLGTKLGDAISQADWNNMKPIWVANRIGSDTFGKLMNGLFKGQYNFAVDIDEAKRFKLSMDEKYHPRNWDAEKLYDFESSTGKAFSLNLQQIMSLYAFSKREQAYSHLLNGGFVFENNSTVIVEKDGKKKTYIHKGATSYKLNEATINEIIDSLTAEQKAYVDEMQKYLSEVMGAKGNEVSMKLYGIKMFNEQFYFPLRSSGAYMERAKEAEMKKQQGQINLVNSGFTHSVKPEAKNPIILANFMDVWAEHCNEMSMYHSMVLPMEDFRKVYNYSTIHDEQFDSASVYQTIQDAYGKAATDYIDQLYRELNAGATVDPRETPWKKLISNFKKSAVMLSASVVVQQFSSIGRAYAVIDPKYFTGTKVNSDTKLSVADEMKKYAPVAIIKEMGGFDTGTKGSAKTYIMAEQYGKGERVKGLVKDEQYRGDLMGYLPAKADEKTWCAIWEAVKRETKAKNSKMDVKSEEFLKLAGERFSEVIEKTQVYDSVLARSANMRSKSAFMAMATSFMAEPTTTINLIEDAIRSGNKRHIARTFGSVAVSIILNNALASIVYAMRDDDEDETFIEKYFQSFTSGMIDDLNPMSYYPFLKDVYSLFQGYDVERADMSVIADLRDALKRVVGLLGKDTSGMDDDELAAHYKQVNEVFMGLLDAGCSVFGVPLKNIRRDANGIINGIITIGTDLSGERATTWNSFWDKVGAAVKDTIPIYAWTKDTAKTDRLYNAIVSGDKAYLSRLKSTYKTEEAYQSAVRKALRENDSRIHAAAQARYNGNTEEYKRIFREIQKEGIFSFDDIMSAINSEVSAIKNGQASDKVTSQYSASGFVEAVILGDAKNAQAMRDDIISTYVANGKTQEEAEKQFASNVSTSIHEALSAGLLDEAGAENMLIEYADKDEEEAASKVSYWVFCDEHPEYDFSESNVNDYREFAEPAGIEIDVFVQYLNGVKGLETKYDEWGDVEVTKREQVLEIIDSLPLTWQQKDALYLAAGYSESKIWDVPW